MPAFKTQVDIGNRAAQHCGAPRMGLDGFAENSRTAGEISACYDNLKEAELEANVWTTAVRYAALRAIDSDTMLLDPALWVETTTYFVGSIVADADGMAWISRIPNNLGLEPSVVYTAWEPYFGPLTVSLWDENTTYTTGELVYTTDGDGTNRVYISLQSGNSDDPSAATAWSATTTYQKNDVITYSSVAYMSLIDLNLNQTPTSSPAAWDSATTYSAGNSVRGSDGVKYTSIAGGNLNNDPVLDFTSTYWTNTGVLVAWATDFTGGDGAVTWRQIGGAEFPMGVTLKTLDLIYPIGSGPLEQSTTRNVFRLPAGHLRKAPQNPKDTPVTWLGGPSGRTFDDWRYDSDYIVTSDTGPIIYRFVANISDVSRMNPMFCEGLAARIGMEVCETITQSNVQVGTVAKIYDEWISRAKVENAIEQDWDDQPDDAYVTVRL